MTNDDSQIRKSLIDELSDVGNLLDKALTKAKNLENHVKSRSYYNDNHEPVNNSIDDIDKAEEENLNAKRSSWDSLKNSALQESISAMEEETTEFSNDTKQARQIKSRTKKLRIDDNWEDDPF